jgi:hypothetical protein
LGGVAFVLLCGGTTRFLLQRRAWLYFVAFVPGCAVVTIFWLSGARGLRVNRAQVQHLYFNVTFFMLCCYQQFCSVNATTKYGVKAA